MFYCRGAPLSWMKVCKACESSPPHSHCRSIFLCGRVYRERWRVRDVSIADMKNASCKIGSSGKMINGISSRERWCCRTWVAQWFNSCLPQLKASYQSDRSPTYSRMCTHKYTSKHTGNLSSSLSESKSLDSPLRDLFFFFFNYAYW